MKSDGWRSGPLVYGHDIRDCPPGVEAPCLLLEAERDAQSLAVPPIPLSPENPSFSASKLVSKAAYNSQCRPSYRLLHSNTAFSGCSICKSSLIPVSILICSNSLALAIPSSSPFNGTGLTLKSRNSPTSTPTNSTCANFRPGQLRAPPDQPTKGLLRAGGSFKCSTGCADGPLVAGTGGLDEVIHRDGSKSTELLPQ